MHSEKQVLDYRDPCTIPGLIKNSKVLDYRDFLLIIPRNSTIPIIKDWEFFLLPGTFSGPSHPDNQGLAVTFFDVL